MDDDGALIGFIRDAETTAAVLLDLRLRTRRLPGQVNRNGRYSAGFGSRSYSGTWVPELTVSSRRMSRYTKIGKAA